MTGWCCICTTGFGRELLDVAALRCGHTFHTDCIRKWIKVQHPGTCPICRQPSHTTHVIPLFFEPDERERADEDEALRQQQQRQVAEVGEALERKLEVGAAASSSQNKYAEVVKKGHGLTDAGYQQQQQLAEAAIESALHVYEAGMKTCSEAVGGVSCIHLLESHTRSLTSSLKHFAGGLKKISGGQGAMATIDRLRPQLLSRIKHRHDVLIAANQQKAQMDEQRRQLNDALRRHGEAEEAYARTTSQLDNVLAQLNRFEKTAPSASSSERRKRVADIAANKRQQAELHEQLKKLVVTRERAECEVDRLINRQLQQRHPSSTSEAGLLLAHTGGSSHH